MSNPFQLSSQKSRVNIEPDSLFHKFGLIRNPFPESGVKSNVFYDKNMIDEIQQIDGWLSSIHDNTDFNNKDNISISPLVLFGSLGVGKTHLLTRLKEGIRSIPKYSVLSVNLTDQGISRLLLSKLLLGGLKELGDKLIDEFELSTTDHSFVPLLDVITYISNKKTHSSIVNKALDSIKDTNSSVYKPLDVIIHKERNREDTSQLRRYFANWLLRNHTTSAQRNKLGISGVLNAEGAAIRAIADLVKVAWQCKLLQSWVIMIDQLEELFRGNVVTPVGQARFLTDLRQLVDCGLTGTPVALIMAWNTQIETSLFEERDATAKHIETNYLALWQRLSNKIDLPGLRVEDIWPFAKDYIDDEVAKSKERLPDSNSARTKFISTLEDQTDSIGSKLKHDSRASLGNNRYAQRYVLEFWRKLASDLASSTS